MWIYSNEINTKETPLKSFEPGNLVEVVSQLHQGLDHPIHPAIKETNYLKGFVVTPQCAKLHS